MKCFTWDDPKDTKLSRGLAVTKYRHDPAFYLHRFGGNVYAMAKRFAVIRNDGYNYGLPEFGVILNAAPPRRAQGMGVAHRVVVEIAPRVETPPDVDDALVAVHFEATPDNDMSLLFSVSPSPTRLESLICVPYRSPVFFDGQCLFYDGEEIFVYETASFNAWERVLGSFDFTPPEEDEVE